MEFPITMIIMSFEIGLLLTGTGSYVDLRRRFSLIDLLRQYNAAPMSVIDANRRQAMSACVGDDIDAVAMAEVVFWYLKLTWRRGAIYSNWVECCTSQNLTKTL